MPTPTNSPDPKPNSKPSSGEVQYPGVADSVQSDLNNLKMLTQARARVRVRVRAEAGVRLASGLRLGSKLASGLG